MSNAVTDPESDYTKLSYTRIAMRVRKLLELNLPPTVGKLEREIATVEADVAAFVVYKIHFRKLKRDHYQDINKAADEILKHLKL